MADESSSNTLGTGMIVGILIVLAVLALIYFYGFRESGAGAGETTPDNNVEFNIQPEGGVPEAPAPGGE